MHFVMDKGFYSLKGITPFLEKYTKFAIGVPFSVDKTKELVDLDRDNIGSADNAIMIGDSIYYAVTHTEMLANRRVYYHVYYDEQRHTYVRRCGFTICTASIPSKS